MTYETFKYEIKKLGLNFYILDTAIVVKNSKSIAICYVDTKKMFFQLNSQKYLCEFGDVKKTTLGEALKYSIFTKLQEIVFIFFKIIIFKNNEKKFFFN